MKFNVKKTLLYLAVVLAVIGASIVWVGGIEDTEKNTPQMKKRGGPQRVEVETARKGEIARTLKVTGEVLATNTVVIAASKEGPISYCPWREGDRVKVGEKLVEIDRQVYRAEVQQAQATLKFVRAKLADLKSGARPEEIDQARAGVQKWQATLEEARTAYEREKGLFAKDFTSQQAVDRARERMEVARAELANAQEKLRMHQAGPTRTEIAVQEAAVGEAAAKLQLARAHLEECLIKAPFDAVITEVHVRPGDLATPRSPLVDMYDPDSLVVRFSVPEAHAAAVRPGLSVKVQLDALAEKTFQGKVVRVYPQLDPGIHTRTVEAKLEGSERLMPHQFARITLKLESAEGAVIVSSEALREKPDGRKIAYIVKDGTVVRRTVQIGIEQGQRVQILSGIQVGEMVVVTGSEGLKDGALVRVMGGDKKDPQSGKAQKEGKVEGRGQKRGDAP